MSDTLPPLTVPVDLAGELLGCTGRHSSYAAAKAGAIPVIPGPGRKKVPLAKLGEIVGRRITAEDIEAAKARLEPKRDAFRSYQADYRQAKAALSPTGA